MRRNNARDNVRINMRHISVFNMKEYGELFNFEDFVHHTPIIFVSIVAHFF